MKEKPNRKHSVGKEAYKRLLNPDCKQGIIDTQREIDKEYFNQLETAAQRGIKHLGNKSFFVVVMVKKERLMENVIRRYFIPRQTLPSPDYDQTVWKFHPGGDLEFIWCTPDHNTCQEIYHHPEKVPADEKWLYEMVCALMEGRLYHEACANFKIQVDADKENPRKLILSEN